MIDERFVFIGAILNSIGALSYLTDTVKGKVKPNRVTWFLWALIPFVALYAQIKQGVGLTALLTFTAGFGPFLIFLASFFNKKAVWKISNLDIFCGILSISGLLFWYITRNANIAILLSIFADAAAGFPTIVKSYHHPESENYKAFLLAAISSIITLLAIKKWDFAYYGFPVYIFIICSLLVLLIRFRLGKIISKTISA